MASEIPQNYTTLRDKIESGGEIDEKDLAIVLENGLFFVENLTSTLKVSFLGSPVGLESESFRRYVYLITLERLLKLSDEAESKDLENSKSLEHFGSFRESLIAKLGLNGDLVSNENIRRLVWLGINSLGDQEPKSEWPMELVRNIASKVIPDNTRLATTITTQTTLD